MKDDNKASNAESSWSAETLDCLQQLHLLFKTQADCIQRGTSCSRSRSARIYYEIADNIASIKSGGPEALTRLYTAVCRYT